MEVGKRHSREEGEEQLERRRQSRTGGDRYGDKETKHGSGKDKDRRKEANQEILFISTQSMTEDDKAWGRRQSRREEDNSANTVILPSENLLSYTHANKDLLSTVAFFPLSLQSCSVTTASYILHTVTVLSTKRPPSCSLNPLFIPSFYTLLPPFCFSICSFHHFPFLFLLHPVLYFSMLAFSVPSALLHP